MITLEVLAARLIKVFEGCKLQAYWDGNGKLWTIGFGHTKNVFKGMTITFDQAVKFLGEDSKPLFNMVRSKNYSLLEGAALVSFGYNCGMGSLARVIGGDITVTEDGFVTRDNKFFGNSSGGLVLDGLVSRRKLESALILIGREITVLTS